MRRPSIIIKYFDYIFLVFALVGSSLWISMSLAAPRDLWTPADIETNVGNLNRALLARNGTAELPYMYSDVFKVYAENMVVRNTPARPDSWVLNASPTPRPLTAVQTPPPEQNTHSLTAISAFAAESVPGKVKLTWAKPEDMKNVRLDGFYVLRALAGEKFGIVKIEGLPSIMIDDGTNESKPLAGPMTAYTYEDPSVLTETGYAYCVVAIGTPALPVTKNGKPILDAEGRPVMEVVEGAAKLSSVSARLEGKTISETHICLIGVVEPVSGTFKIFKWQRDTQRWASATFQVSVGGEVGQEAKFEGKKIDFRTGYVLVMTFTRKDVIEGKTVTHKLAKLETPLKPDAQPLEIELGGAKEPTNVRNVFEVVLTVQ